MNIHIDNNENEFDYVVKQLNFIKKMTTKNEISGLLIMLFLLSLLITFVAMLFYPIVDRIDIYNIIIISSSLVVFEVLMIALFQNNCKKGNVVFDELSDEIELRKNNTISEYRQIYKNTRFYIKKYLASTELPLIQGKYGSTIFFLCTIVIYILLIVIMYNKKV